MRLELINTGTELLLGNTVNTHLAYIGETLLPLGLRITRQVCVPDGQSGGGILPPSPNTAQQASPQMGGPIRDALIESFTRNDIVIITGGLGPTSDDITREIAAELLGMSLIEDATILSAIIARLAKRHQEINEQTKRQALVPSGAQALTNDFGTAPGLYFPAQDSKPHLLLLPGPPRELRPMFINQVVPLLRRICHGKVRPTEMRNFRLSGLGESQIAAGVEPALLALGDDLEIGYCARPGEVIVRVLGSAEQMEAARNVVAAAFPNAFFSATDQSLEETVVDLLKRFGRTLATAESCTGGLIGHRITNVPGSSAIMLRGYITYSNQSKIELLGIPENLLSEHGAVSAEVCRAMVEGCLARAGTDYSVAVTGIAGPDGGTAQKPVGTVFIGLASRDGQPTIVEQHFHANDRETFKLIVSQKALDLIRRRVVGFV